MTTLNDELLKDDTLDSFCVTGDAPWSIMTSAETNSSLAAVLAGLLIATIAVMFNWPEERHTIALFASGVVVLALDSYLFSHVKAVQPFTPFPVISAHQDRIDEACERAWIQAMPASGMLATGGVALVCGLAWMMTTYETQSKTTKAFLPTLGALLTATVITITTLLLVATTLQYLDVVDQAEGWPLLPIALGFAMAIVIPSLILIAKSTLALRDEINTRNKAIAVTNTEQPPIELEPGSNGPFDFADALKIGTLATGAYALVGPLFAGTYALVNLTESGLFIWGAVVFGLIYPSVVALLMSRALPRPAKTSRPESPADKPPSASHPHPPARDGAISASVVIAFTVTAPHKDSL